MSGVKLASTIGYQADLLAHVYATAEPFVPEAADLGRYAFVSWVRNGLAGAITEQPPAGGSRAVIRARFDLTADGLPMEPEPQPITIDKLLSLRGPADVIGIDARQVIRRFPTDGVELTDNSVLATVEFNRPDLPWLHSPFPVVNDRLAPWIALIVCPAPRATFGAGSEGLPEWVEVPASELQPLDDAWAWAHAQLLGNAGEGPSVESRLTDAFADQNLSRLICPRRLAEQGDYVACVVPTFRAGALAGLGNTKQIADAGTSWAWQTNDQAAMVKLPVYHRWSFSVGQSSNFEALARRLVSLPAPPAIGRRVVDLRAPGGGVPVDLTGPGAVQTIEGVLHSPAPLPPSAPPPAEWPAARTEALRDTLEAKADDPDLPHLGARLYARFQRGKQDLPDPLPTIGVKSDWFVALNLRPADRIAAGVGTRVVEHDQHRLMEAAWAQVGEVERANAALGRLQFGRFVAESLLAKTLAKFELGPMIAATGPVHGKIPFPGDDRRTLYAAVVNSALPMAAAGPAFRKAITGGPIGKALTKALVAGHGAAVGNILVEAGGIRDMRRVHAEPESLAPVDMAAIATLPVEALAGVLGVRADVAPQTALGRFAGPRATFRRLAVPTARWRMPAEDVATARATVRMGKLTAALDDRGLDAGRREAIGASIAQMMRVAPGLERAGTAAFARLERELGPAVRGGGEDQLRRSRFAKFGGRVGRDVVAAPGNRKLADSLVAIVQGSGATKLPKTPPSSPPKVTGELLLKALQPGPLATARAKGLLGQLPPWLPNDWFADELVTPIMAAPRFDRPMFEALRDKQPEWLIANLGDIKQRDFVTLLLDNPRFIEAYLIGLSDEMGRELLWRDYPTDQRGTYFWRFWDADDDLTEQIARFAGGPLGSHLVTNNPPAERVVMLLRGEVIKRHPDSIFVAVRRQETGDDAIFSTPPGPGETGAITFHAQLAADTMLVGFDLTRQQVQAGDWWFLLAEHPTAPRFGLDLEGTLPPGAENPGKLNDLEWGDLPMWTGRFLRASAGITVADEHGSYTWGSTAAATARMLLQNPARAAFGGTELLTGTDQP